MHQEDNDNYMYKKSLTIEGGMKMKNKVFAIMLGMTFLLSSQLFAQSSVDPCDGTKLYPNGTTTAGQVVTKDGQISIVAAHEELAEPFEHRSPLASEAAARRRPPHPVQRRVGTSPSRWANLPGAAPKAPPVESLRPGA